MWEKEDIYFVKTRASSTVMNLIQLKPCVAVTGCIGSGKSATIHHVALKLKQKGYNIVPSDNYEPLDIYRDEHYFEGRHTVFVLDDPFGKVGLDENILRKWELSLDKIKFACGIMDTRDSLGGMLRASQLRGKSKLLISSRSNTYDSRQMLYLKQSLMIEECNFFSNSFCLTDDEKRGILSMYNKECRLEDVKSDCGWFPLSCRFAFAKKSMDEIINIFTSLPREIENDIHKIKLSNKAQFCCVCLCVLFREGFDRNWLYQWSSTSDVNRKVKIKHVCKENCIDVELETGRFQLLHSFTGLIIGSYVKEIGDKIVLIHDTIYDISAKVCGENLFLCFLKHSSSKFIAERYILQELVDTDITMFSIPISDQHEDAYFRRIFDDVDADDSTSFVFNRQLKHKVYINTLLQHMNKRHQLIRLKNVLNAPLHIRAVEECLAKIDNKGFEIHLLFCMDLGITLDQTNIFISACKNGNIHSVRYFLEAKRYEEDVRILRQVNSKNETPLFIAVQNGHFGIVKILLEHGSNVNVASTSTQYNGLSNYYSYALSTLHSTYSDTRNGCTPLYVASYYKCIDTVQILLEYKADTSICGYGGWSPLYIASIQGSTDIVRLLLEHGAETSLCDDRGQSPLHVASKYGHTEVVEVLMQYNADYHLVDIDGESPLFKASQSGNTHIFVSLLRYGANVSECNIRNESPLYAASREGHNEIIHILLDDEADSTVCNRRNESPLFVASQNGRACSVRTLLMHNSDSSVCDKLNRSPLYVATMNNHHNVVDVLLKNGAVATLTVTNDEGNTPLHISSYNGNTAISELLLQYGGNSNISTCNDCGESPLFIASDRGNRDLVKLLLVYGADPSICNTESVSPLLSTVVKGNVAIVSLLLDHSVSEISLCDEKGQSPLYVASSNGYTEIVQLLLDQGADTSLCTREKWSPLHVASHNNNVETVELLLKYGADTSICMTDGETPLLIACGRNNTDVVDLLLKYGSESSICNRTGESPLYIASEYNNIGVVDLLLKYGADTSICNIDRRSPLYIAAFNGNLRIVKLLLEHIPYTGTTLRDDSEQSLFYIDPNAGITHVDQQMLENQEVNLVSSLSTYFHNRQCTDERWDDICTLIKQVFENQQLKLISPLYAAFVEGHSNVTCVYIKHLQERHIL